MGPFDSDQEGERIFLECESPTAARAAVVVAGFPNQTPDVGLPRVDSRVEVCISYTP